MNSRRFMGSPLPRDHSLSHSLNVSLVHRSNDCRRLAASGHSTSFSRCPRYVRSSPVSGRIARIAGRLKVPIPVVSRCSKTRVHNPDLLDRLVGAGEKRLRHVRPRAFAIFRLMKSSSFVAWWTGSLPSFAPASSRLHRCLPDGPNQYYFLRNSRDRPPRRIRETGNIEGTAWRTVGRREVRSGS